MQRFPADGIPGSTLFNHCALRNVAPCFTIPSAEMTDGVRMILCDGCGQPATPEHLAERVRRLELATRYRPIHIQVLFLAGAPASGIEDDFYSSAGANGSANDIHRTDLDRFFEALQIVPAAVRSHEDSLAEFQRRGYYLTFAVECPCEMAVKSETVVERMASVVVKRIQLSYKPKCIVLLSSATQPLIRVLQDAGLGNRLVLSNGLPVSWPLSSDPSSSGKLGNALRLLLAEIQDRMKTE